MNSCKNCQHTFAGKYCNHCGEKLLTDDDFSIKTLLHQAFGEITSIDSKLLKTFTLMFKNPGSLSKKITSGIRVPYLKPFQISVICNVLFFIFLSDTDLFRTPAKWLFNENTAYFGTKVMTKVEKSMQIKNLSLNEIKTSYDTISINASKSLLILLIPFIASIGILINRKLPFGKHLLFATLYFSQLLLCTTLLFVIITKLTLPNKWFFIVPTFVMALGYYILSVNRFYDKKWWFSSLIGVVGMILLFVFISMYRTFINIISLALL